MYPWAFFNTKEKLKRFLPREIFYFVVFFYSSKIVMQKVVLLIGLEKYYSNLSEMLWNIRPDAYLIVLLPYFVFVLVRLRRRSNEKPAEEHYTDEQRKGMDRKLKVVLFLLPIMGMAILLIYIFYPKVIYKNFYGESIDCKCFGWEKRVEPNKALFGPQNEAWGLCFGQLYNCEE